MYCHLLRHLSEQHTLKHVNYVLSHFKKQWRKLKSNLTYISNVFLRRQAESRQVLCVALSKTRCLFSLSANQTVWGEIKIDAACPTLKRTQTIQKLSAMHSNGVSQYFKSNHAETWHLITSILETRQSWCLICRKTESKASWLACWLSLVRADLGSANRLELPVPFSCNTRAKRCTQTAAEVNQSQLSHGTSTKSILIRTSRHAPYL